MSPSSNENRVLRKDIMYIYICIYKNMYIIYIFIYIYVSWKSRDQKNISPLKLIKTHESIGGNPN